MADAGPIAEAGAIPYAPRPMETITVREARRLALAKSGFLKPEWTGLPARAAGAGARARGAAHRIIERFGYLQLDTVSVAGARSHALVLLSRLEGFDPELGEALLQPGEPLFEHWGHEVCWMPLSLYPALGFRRRLYRDHPWWGNILGTWPELVREIVARIEAEGPLRSADFEGGSRGGWWDHTPAKMVLVALWSSGRLGVRERRGFQRQFDLIERVIPDSVRFLEMADDPALDALLLKALDGLGWSETGTLAQTWRLRHQAARIKGSLSRLCEQGSIIPCALVDPAGSRRAGWVRREDRELATRLESIRPRADRGVLLSPFDPLLWDRARVLRLFGFDQILEIFKPAPQRRYGYYCLPVLAGERLVARFDLKAERRAGRLRVISAHYESPRGGGTATSDRAAARGAVARLGDALKLKPVGAR